MIVALYALVVAAAFGGVRLVVPAFLAVIAVDIAGATHWAEVSQGRTKPGARRHAVLFGIVLVPLLLFVLAAPFSRLLAGPQGRRYCDGLERCGSATGECIDIAVARSPTQDRITAHCARCVDETPCAELEACADLCGW